MNTTMTRARRLRAALYVRYGHGYISKVAREIGYSRQHVSIVLNEEFSSDVVLDRIEAWLAEREEQEAQQEAA